MTLPRVLLVGGGLTSAAIACRLANLPIVVTCWDKARKPGGRLTTFKWRAGQVDLGAQLITCKHAERSLMGELIKSGVLKPITFETQHIDEDLKEEENENPISMAVDDVTWQHWDHEILLTKPENYVAHQGTESLISYLWTRAGITPASDHFLTFLNHTKDGLWLAQSRPHQAEGLKFEAVVLTQPVPQYIGNPSPEGRPSGNFMDRIAEDETLLANLNQVVYNSCYALGLFYEQPTDLKINWTLKYFPNHPVIRYISVDSLKRGTQAPTSVSVLTHRSWAKANLHLTKESAKPILLSAVMDILPKLPSPDHVKSHRWLYSQTENPYPQNPGAVTFCKEPLLLGAGDSFSQSNVEGCLVSAEKAVKILKDNLLSL